MQLVVVNGGMMLWLLFVVLLSSCCEASDSVASSTGQHISLLTDLSGDIGRSFNIDVVLVGVFVFVPIIVL